jgi:hypothetical protein
MELLTTKGLKNHSTICTMKKKVLLLVTELRYESESETCTFG